MSLSPISARDFADRIRPHLKAPEAAGAATRFRMGFGVQEKFLSVGGDGARYRPAAVLVPVIDRAEGGTVLLTERCAHLGDHAGQVSFPGGRVEETDAGIRAAALREMREETGLPESHVVHIIGALDQRGTVSYFRVTPVVAMMAPFPPVPQAAEVAAIFEVPLAHVLDPARHEALHTSPADGGPRQMYAIRFKNHFIFGFTARILVQLAEIWHDGAYAPDASVFGRGN